MAMGTAMKKVLLAAAAAWMALGAAPALSADLAARPYTKAPAMIAAIYDWSGFYIGANAGGGSARNCWTNTTLSAAEGCHNATGALVGGQVGYRWQTGTWVFGAEAQGNWADFKGSNPSLFVPGATNQSKTNAIGVFTGQVGYTWNNVLWYVKGGGAVANDKNKNTHNKTKATKNKQQNKKNHTLSFSTVPAGTTSRTDAIGQDVDMATV